jgi:hypothetical protein
MNDEQMKSLVAKYKLSLESIGIPKKQMNESLYFGDLERHDLLAHAHFLLDGIEEMIGDPSKRDKLMRHLASVQMIFGFTFVFTLKELKEHNR